MTGAEACQLQDTLLPFPIVKDTFIGLIDFANETEDDLDFLLSEAEVVFRCFMDDDLLDQSISVLLRSIRANGSALSACGF